MRFQSLSLKWSKADAEGHRVIIRMECPEWAFHTETDGRWLRPIVGWEVGGMAPRILYWAMVTF